MSITLPAPVQDFTVRDDRVVRLIIIGNQPAPARARSEGHAGQEGLDWPCR